MAITFPNSPSSGDTHTTSNGLQYTYDGEKWTTIGTNSAGTWTRTGTTVSLTTAGDDLNVDSGTLFVDASTNRVGVGTTSPTYPLQVETTATGTTAGSNGVMFVQSQASGRDAHIRFGDNVNATARVGYLSNSLYAYVNGQERARIDSSGRLGIGDSAPDVEFSLKGTSDVISRVQATDQSNARVRIQAGNASSSYLEFGDSDDDDVGEIVYGHSDNHMRFRTNGSERLRLDSSGNLFIGGTTAASADIALNANGSAAFKGDVQIGEGGFASQDKTGLYQSATAGFCNVYHSASASSSFLKFTKYDAGAAGSFNVKAEITDSGSATFAARTNIGTGTLSDVALALYNDTTTAGEPTLYIQNDQSGGNLLQGFGGGSEKVRITGGGRLGLGTSSPSGLLSIHEAASSTSNYINITNNATGTSSWSNGMLVGVNATGDALCWQNESSNLLFGTSNSERMRLDSSGRLLLGLSSSIGGHALLQVQGSGNRKAHFHQPDTGGSIIQFTNATTGTGTSDGFEVALNGSEDGQVWLYESGNIKFGTANSERMLIDSAGQTSWYRSTDNVSAQVIFVQSNVTATRRIQWEVLADGDTQNRTGVYTTISSDERMKKDIVDASSQWDDIKNIRMRKFRYKADGDESPLQLGVIAQELELVCPNLVTKKSATAEMSAESEGSIAEGEDVLSWKQSIVHLKALKALQEAMARIETLEAEVAALKSA